MESISTNLSSNKPETLNKLVTRSSFEIAVPPPSLSHKLFESEPAFPHEIELRKSLTFYNRLTSYQLPIHEPAFPDLPEITNPLILQNRNKALETINTMLSSINKLKQEFQDDQEEGPVCPYQRTKIQYLGKNFVPPSVQEIIVPENYSEKIAVKSTLVVGKHYTDLMITKLQQMSAEAANLSYPGIKTELLGNAFSVLSATATGDRWVEDRQKAAAHLEFAEMIRHIPVKDILEDPTTIAKKVLTRFMEINFDVLVHREESNSVWEFLSKKSLDFSS